MSIENDKMIERQIAARGVSDPAVLKAMRRVDRIHFIPENMRSRAYLDGPLPIGSDQTISQPYIVALMTEMLQLGPGDRVLEIGTGSGYQTAVLAEITREVFTIEVHESLGVRARRLLESMGYDYIHFHVGDGYGGWPEEAPFDRILLTAAPPRIPPRLFEQLAIGGRLVAPVGSFPQRLELVVRTEQGKQVESGIPVSFVPMTGRIQEEAGEE